jgi:hypothetical protein
MTLKNAESTRNQVYRFFLKGSNAIEVIMYYIQQIHALEDIDFPGIFSSDWDTSIIINPNLPPSQFNTIFETLVPIIQKQLIILSNEISNSPYFHNSVQSGCLTAKDFIDSVPDYEDYRKYPIVYKKDRQSLLTIFDDSKNETHIINYVESLGNSGKGTFVSSNLRGGVSPQDKTTPPKFYLGRILLSIVASKNVFLPVELFDISMNYQNDDLGYAWESHSEYIIQNETVNFRVISPTALYFDLSKCVMNAEKSNNATKRSKISARTKRLENIMEKMIVPYQNKNQTIKENLNRHLKSLSLVGNLRKQMNLTKKNKNRLISHV